MEGPSFKLISKLKSLWTSSDGFFLSGQVTDAETEAKYLATLRARNPDDFQLIFSDRALLLRLTQSFLSRHGVPALRHSPLAESQLSPTEILQRIVLGAFALETKTELEFEYGVIEVNRLSYKLDQIDEPLDKVRIQKSVHLLTIPSRVAPLVARGVRAIAPQALYKKWNQRVIEKYLATAKATLKPEVLPPPIATLSKTELARLTYEKEYAKILELGFLGDEAFWPRSKDDNLHRDYRAYPGFKNEIDGIYKYEIDKKLLAASESREIKNHVFGVWKTHYKIDPSSPRLTKIQDEILKVVRAAGSYKTKPPG